MAATRRNAMLIQETRNRVQTSQLLNRLQDHVDGKVDLSTTQIKAVEILLKKSLPDLSAVTLSGDAENPLNIVGKIERVILDGGSNTSD